MTIGERIVADLRADLFAHLDRLDASFYDTAKIGELVSRLTADTTQMKSAFGSSASIALRNLFMFVGAIGMMVIRAPSSPALVLVAIPIIVLPLVASGPVGAAAVARGAGPARRCHRLRRRKSRRGAHHAGIRGRAGDIARFSAAVRPPTRRRAMPPARASI